MKWIASQTRFMLKKMMGRNYDSLTADAQKKLNILVAGTDIAILVLLINLL
ncbi:MAG: hypothetical protein HQM12_21330 [SAR324 cluster bacterium]|nr:hypothetical protein [SAR324 cluster bacterium]MBF0351103.1 hypothetical protein [SAR324 cluster bacterium]